MKGFLAILLVLSLAWMPACLLPKEQPAAGIDDDDAGDDDAADDDAVGDDDDAVGDDDDAVGDDDDAVGDDDDAVGDDDDAVGDDDDATTPDHPVGDFSVVWSWIFQWSDPGIGSEYASTAAVWAIANNGINGALRFFLLDGSQQVVCEFELTLAGQEMTPAFPVATAAWQTSGQYGSDTCYPENVGSSTSAFFAIAPKQDAFLQIETEYGITVAEQIAAEDYALNETGLTETDYFMYRGETAADMVPLGFVFEL